MNNNAYLPSADRYSAVIKSEIRYIKVTTVMFIEQRNLRSLALHSSKALQEPCRNSSLLIGINRRATTNRAGCIQLYSYTFSEAESYYMILIIRNSTQMNPISQPVDSSPFFCDIIIEFC